MIRRPRAAFTLLEILMVLALFGLIAAVVIGGSGTLLQSATRDDPENAALSALAGARHAAVLSGRPVDLHYDEQTRVLDWGAGRQGVGGGDGLRLLPAERTGAVLIGGRIEENPLARVRFYPDGTCDPFRLEIVRDQSRRLLAVDPWTCTVLAAVPERHP